MHNFIRKTVLGVALAGSFVGIIGATAPAARAAESSSYADVWAYRGKFYPLRQDGYRDKVGFDLEAQTWDGVTFDSNELWIERIATGAVVAEWDVETFDSPRTRYDSWATWNGTRDDGSKVPVGRYRIVSTWTDSSDWSSRVVAQASAVVEVATGTRTIRKTADQDGQDAVSKTTTGNCNWGRQIDRAIQATCYGGTARAVWKVRIPAGFKVASVRVFCERGIVACAGERMATTRSGSRLTITFEVHANRWSQCIVYGPLVRFTDRVRI